MKKKYIYAGLLLAILILTIFVITFKFYKYDLEGTYSSGGEPNPDSIYLVLKNKEFTLYNQEKILDRGSIKEMNLNHTPDMYKLISENNTRTGYVVPDKNHIALLGFQGMDFSLKKISKNAVYLEYASE